MALKKTAIYIIRNDLRLHDNECLQFAHRNSDYLIPLFCFQKEYFKGTYHYNFQRSGVHRTKFLLETVSNLRTEFQKRGSNLVLRQKSLVNTVEELADQCLKGAPVNCIVMQKEVCSEEIAEEKALDEWCKQKNIQLHRLWGSTLYNIGDLPFNRRGVPDTFTQFRKIVEARCEVRGVIKTPDKLNSLPPIQGASLGTIPSLEDLGHEKPHTVDQRSAFPFHGGETAALVRVKNYLWGTDALATYKETRNGLLGEAYSTKFSPWLANGSLSPRTVYQLVKQYEKEKVENQSTYWVIFELIWRDYFKFVCWKYGARVFYQSGIMNKQIPWKTDMKLFHKWSQGQTGVPFVDANMRELLHTGWMSNRGRQNVASFLVKDLKLDWRLGAEWFESLLLDHDVCSNYGNWNYAAGIGNDPRQDRKFNMIKQALDYDSDGSFVKTWCPELSNLPQGKFHIPWTLSDKECEKVNFSRDVDYPEPIIVAPEWARYTHKTGPKSQSKQQGKKGENQQWKGKKRGIDFYFKSPNTKS